MKEGAPEETPNALETTEAERRFFSEDPNLDPYDLSMLSPKPKPLRIVLALGVLLACCYLLYDFSTEFAYVFQAGTPKDFQTLDQDQTRQKLAKGEIPSNRFVKLSGTPNYPPFLWETLGEYGRGPGAGEHARVLVFPRDSEQTADVVHKGNTVTLTYFPLIVSYYENNATPREHLLGTFEGRLIQAKDAPFFDPIRQFLVDHYNLFVPDEAYILLEGETPGDYWLYAALLLFLVVVILINVFIIKRQLTTLRRTSK